MQLSPARYHRPEGEQFLTKSGHGWTKGNQAENVTGYIFLLTGGKPCNFDERWNLQKLEETLLLLLLGRDIIIIIIIYYIIYIIYIIIILLYNN
jgi:hypothetical protein